MFTVVWINAEIVVDCGYGGVTLKKMFRIGVLAQIKVHNWSIGTYESVDLNQVSSIFLK